MSKFKVGDILTHKAYATDPAALYAPRFFVLSINTDSPACYDCRIISVRDDTDNFDKKFSFREDELITYEEYKKSVLSTFEKTVQSISSAEELKAYISSIAKN